MSRPPDYMGRVSEALSEVMKDIGVTETLVMKRRKAWLVIETIQNIYNLSQEDRIYDRIYKFGSQTEGSTTLGLKSDIDTLTSLNTLRVIQSMSEWKPDVSTCMMIQTENISPGYCYLQVIREDVPIYVNEIHDICGSEMFTIDREGRLLVKNNVLYKAIPDMDKHGPAMTVPERPGYNAADTVLGHHCESSPHQVISWLQKQRKGKWPTEDVLKDCRNAGCFVVPVGCKVHSPDILESELEWRISTSLQERYLMFSLNITQLMCYILMKMILKTHIDPYVEDVLSSFMCKNVLLYCVANSTLDWHAGKLLAYLHKCVYMLKECIEQRNCPHLMIPENNLLAGHMTDSQRGKLLDIVNNLMKSDALIQMLYKIQIDDLGKRLMIKLSMTPYHIQSANFHFQNISFHLELAQTLTQSRYLKQVLDNIKSESLEIVNKYLLKIYLTLERYRNEDDLQCTASERLIPLVSSTMGSVIACRNLDSHTTISDQAFTYLEAGIESDALSGRLKLISVLYCTGDMERAEHELTIIQTKYNISYVQPECGCFCKVKAESDDQLRIKCYMGLCTRFLQCEINCVPHELRYEILRSYNEEDRQMRTEDDVWMDFIVVDSIPYMYFLQYKIYGHLHRRTKQLEALSNFAQSIELEVDFQQHEETALNLLGQCFEQENRPVLALQSYIKSLKHRTRNNAAGFLLCLLLFKLWKQDKTSSYKQHHQHHA